MMMLPPLTQRGMVGAEARDRDLPRETMRVAIATNLRSFEMLVAHPLAACLQALAYAVPLNLPEVATLRFKASRLDAVDAEVERHLRASDPSSPHPIWRFSPNFARPVLQPSGVRNFVVETTRGCWKTGGYPSEAVYSFESRCSSCGSGALQTGALILPRKAVATAHAISTTLSGELLVGVRFLRDWISSGFLQGTLAPVLCLRESQEEPASGIPLAESACEATSDAPDRLDDLHREWAALCKRHSPGLRPHRMMVQWIPRVEPAIDVATTAFTQKCSPWAEPVKPPACARCGSYLGWYRIGRMAIGARASTGAVHCAGFVGGEAGHGRPYHELICDERTLARLPAALLKCMRLEECFDGGTTPRRASVRRGGSRG
jgi:hypothetical protein